ncbi:MAG: MFS transporter [Gemmatimonas sp.]|nr:MFS transporter [Gemmatimonas sp.]
MTTNPGELVSPTTSDQTANSRDTSFFGHPAGLSTLFFTEMWERFSYYGMRALLILFMTAAAVDGGLGMDVATAGAIYGLYTAAVYLAALPGGWIADRLIGQRRAVLVGGIVIAAGHFSMALPVVTGSFGELPPFYTGLLLIVVGTGFLKPNVSALVGELYGTGDARRDAGFSIFYMGINLGAFAAPLVTSFLGEQINWHLGFAAAGVGMTLGVVQYVVGQRRLGSAGTAISRGRAIAEESSERRPAILIAGSIAAVGVLLILQIRGSIDLMTAVGLASASGLILLLLSVVYFGALLTDGQLSTLERKRIGVIAILFLFSALFWSGFEQAGSSLNLFARDLTDRVLAGWEMPAGFLQSVNAFFIIIFAPVFAWLWIWLDRRGRDPSSPLKFAVGLIALGTGFVVMVGASAAAASGQLVSPAWLVLTYFLHTIGELALSPVGLSTVTKLAPKRMAGQMMGVWFLSISLGSVFAGQVAGLYESLPLTELFGAVAATMVAGGLLLLLLSRPLRAMMGGLKQHQKAAPM